MKKKWTEEGKGMGGQTLKIVDVSNEQPLTEKAKFLQIEHLSWKWFFVYQNFLKISKKSQFFLNFLPIF